GAAILSPRFRPLLREAPRARLLRPPRTLLQRSLPDSTKLAAAALHPRPRHQSFLRIRSPLAASLAPLPPRRDPPLLPSPHSPRESPAASRISKTRPPCG